MSWDRNRFWTYPDLGKWGRREELLVCTARVADRFSEAGVYWTAGQASSSVSASVRVKGVALADEKLTVFYPPAGLLHDL